MFVIDGVNELGLHHANWGHGGDGDKFTDLNVLNQGSANGLPGDKNVCYNFKQAMMINFYPIADLSASPQQWCDMTDAITINDDVTVNVIEVKQGQDFKLATKITNCAEEVCSVSYRWMLMRDNEEVMSMASGYWGSFSPFHIGRIENRMSVPQGIPNGDYTMVFMTKSSLTQEWKPVRDNPINKVYILVSDDSVIVTVPDQHTGDPELYMSTHPSIAYDSYSGCLEILCDLINPTYNNYEGSFRIEINTDNSSAEYQPEVCIYEDTNVKYRFFVPKSSFDPDTGTVRNINIWYRYDDGEIELSTMRPGGIMNQLADKKNGDITIYTLQGVTVAVIRRDEIQTVYNDIRSLPCGVYIIKDGSHTRKIIK